YFRLQMKDTAELSLYEQRERTARHLWCRINKSNLADLRALNETPPSEPSGQNKSAKPLCTAVIKKFLPKPGPRPQRKTRSSVPRYRSGEILTRCIVQRCPHTTRDVHYD